MEKQNILFCILWILQIFHISKNIVSLKLINDKTLKNNQTFTEFDSKNKTIENENFYYEENFPNWILNHPLRSDIAKSRQKRRFVEFPTGSSLNIYTVTAFSPNRMSFLVSSRMYYYLGSHNPYLYFLMTPQDTRRKARNIHESYYQRSTIFTFLENLFTSMDHNGYECMLRAICEISNTPFQHGLLGEIINLLASISNGPDVSHYSIYDDYHKAEKRGKGKDNCSILYPECPTSVLKLISQIIHS